MYKIQLYPLNWTECASHFFHQRMNHHQHLSAATTWLHIPDNLGHPLAWKKWLFELIQPVVDESFAGKVAHVIGIWNESSAFLATLLSTTSVKVKGEKGRDSYLASFTFPCSRGIIESSTGKISSCKPCEVVLVPWRLRYKFTRILHTLMSNNRQLFWSNMPFSSNENFRCASCLYASTES